MQQIPVEFWIMIGAGIVFVICGLLMIALVVAGSRDTTPDALSMLDNFETIEIEGDDPGTVIFIHRYKDEGDDNEIT